jgi:hypothetical protein
LDFELSDNDQYNKILNSNILLNLYKWELFQENLVD